VHCSAALSDTPPGWAQAAASNAIPMDLKIILSITCTFSLRPPTANS
jgi:hypothetical protein